MEGQVTRSDLSRCFVHAESLIVVQYEQIGLFSPVWNGCRKGAALTQLSQIPRRRTVRSSVGFAPQPELLG